MSSVNQQYIADHLGISRTTVSRCFTNHPGINPTTRSKVFALAAKLNYKHLQPRTPKKTDSGSKSIGVLVCSDAEEFSHGEYESPGVEILPGVSEFAQLNQWQIEVNFIAPTDKSIADPSYAKIKAIRRRQWNGIILIYPFFPAIIEELTARFPCVSLVEQYGRVSVDCVDVDHFKGISLLVDRLVQRGHTRIGFFSRKYAIEAVWSYRRFSAYVEKLSRLGLRYIEDDVIHLDISTPHATARGYQEAVSRIKNGVTAWVCAADHQAYDLIIALEKEGYNVPRDISVTGFDGILRPPGAPILETVRIPYYEIGYAGGRRLFDRIQKRFEPPQQILLECRLHEGETIGPVKR